MQKDVVYIDVEDDITAIIGKVKAAKAHIVALVPPKRIGIIQSSVNLKLVHRAAEQVKKRLVIVSNDTALTALAAVVGIPVAKNLQSKPELAEVAALSIDDGDDIIDGAALDGVNIDGNGTPEAISNVDDGTAHPSTADGVATSGLSSKIKISKSSKIPNFDSFRKKLFIGLAAAILLAGFLVWALAFAPRAVITVKAKTSSSALMTSVTIGDGLTTSLHDGTIKSTTQTTNKDVAKSGTATGEKNIGAKATGTVKLMNSDGQSATVPAGTVIQADGVEFSLDKDVVVPGGVVCHGVVCPGSASGTITASTGGAASNGISGPADVAQDFISGSITPSTSGGTDQIVKVVQQSDIDTLTDSITSDVTDDSKTINSLAGQFSDKYIALRDTFAHKLGDVKSSPAVGAATTDGNFTVTVPVAYSMAGVSDQELSKFLDAYFAQRTDGKSDQKVYDNGLQGVSFTGVTATKDGYLASITTNGKIGPVIDEEALKVFAKGKRTGDIQDHIQQINGVGSVDVKLSPFWVNSAPNDTKRIQVVFDVNG
ncbi:MAG: hypothetical protein ABI397_00615 [Candidatus Saccharimonas sp.]